MDTKYYFRFLVRLILWIGGGFFVRIGLEADDAQGLAESVATFVIAAFMVGSSTLWSLYETRKQAGTDRQVTTHQGTGTRHPLWVLGLAGVALSFLSGCQLEPEQRIYLANATYTETATLLQKAVEDGKIKDAESLVLLKALAIEADAAIDKATDAYLRGDELSLPQLLKEVDAALDRFVKTLKEYEEVSLWQSPASLRWLRPSESLVPPLAA